MSAYVVAGSHIVHQNIVGEVIIVDLQQGHYFSLTECAPHIWEAIVEGSDKDATIEKLCSIFRASKDEIRSAVNAVIDQLVRDEVIIPAQNELSFAPPSLTATDNATEKLAFTPPVVEKYTDMEDVLLLDPIHDFDDAGLPIMPASTEKN